MVPIYSTNTKEVYQYIPTRKAQCHMITMIPHVSFFEKINPLVSPRIHQIFVLCASMLGSHGCTEMGNVFFTQEDLKVWNI